MICQPRVIYSLKKIFLCLGYLVVALGVDFTYQSTRSSDVLILAITLHLAALLNFFGGTILITRNHMVFILSYFVRVRRTKKLLNLNLIPTHGGFNVCAL